MPDFSQYTQTFSKLTDSININLGNYSVPFTYWEVIAIVFLLFLLVLSMAQFRRHFVDWSLKGAVFGVFFGFLLALILEGFLVIGGKTALTQLLGWKNPPPPVAQALDSGRAQLVKVLGTETTIPSSYAKETPTIQSVVNSLQSLNPGDQEKLRSLICKP